MTKTENIYLSGKIILIDRPSIASKIPIPSQHRWIYLPRVARRDPPHFPIRLGMINLDPSVRVVTLT